MEIEPGPTSVSMQLGRLVWKLNFTRLPELGWCRWVLSHDKRFFHAGANAREHVRPNHRYFPKVLQAK